MKFRHLTLFLVIFLTGCGSLSGEAAMETTEAPITTEVTVTTEASLQPGLVAETTSPMETELLTMLIRPDQADLVRVQDYIPDVLVELKYSSDDNFTGQRIYDFEDLFLRYGTVVKLKAAAEEFRTMGLKMKIWDGFRPVSAQFRLWEICPDDTYVADPHKGYSNHSRGFAVDLTLVDADGREIQMPTAYDDFSGRADRDYSECDAITTENARLLERIMEKHGFSGYWGEWWHFNDKDKYEVETCFDPALITGKKLLTESFLLKDPRQDSDIVLTVPAGERVTFLGFRDGYSLVEYWGYRGYILSEHLE